jgi:adenosylmethionine-8-amino-7-oxononanoate aminotransferase
LPQKIFTISKKHGIYQRTLGNIIMVIPPLAISEKELDFLMDGTIKTIKEVSSRI